MVNTAPTGTAPDPHSGIRDLDSGQLSRNGLVGLVLASYVPAVGLASVPGLGSRVASATDLALAVATFAGLIGFINYGSRFVATLAMDGLLPARTGRIHPRHQSPAAAVVTICTFGLGAILVLVALNPDNVVGVYNAVATLIVYVWVIPYLLICAGAVRLLAREGRLDPMTVIGATLGAAAMAWHYLNGLFNPPAAPLDVMSYLALIAVAAVLVVFLTIDSRSTTDKE